MIAVALKKGGGDYALNTGKMPGLFMGEMFYIFFSEYLKIIGATFVQRSNTKTFHRLTQNLHYSFSGLDKLKLFYFILRHLTTHSALFHRRNLQTRFQRLFTYSGTRS